MVDSSKVNKKIYNGIYWSVLFPLLAGYLGGAVLAMVIGRTMGPEGLANMGLIMPLNLFFAVVGSIFSYGGVLVSSQLTGEGKHREARQACTVANVACAVFCLLISVLGIIFLRPLLAFMQIPEELFSESYRSALFLFSAGVFSAGWMVVFGMLRLNGLNKYVNIFSAVHVAALAVTTVVLVGFRGWGVDGVFAGMAIGNFLRGAGAFVVFLLKKTSITFARVGPPDFLRLTWRIFRNGIVSASDEMVELICVPLLNAFIINTYGLMALSAYSVYGQVHGTLIVGLAVANSQALTPLLGAFVGEHDSASSRQALRYATIRGIVTSIPLGLAVVVFARPLCAMFGLGGDAEAMSVAVPLMVIAGISVPLAMLNNLFINVYNSFNRVIISNILNVGRIGAFLLPCVFILSHFFGVMGVWYAFLACEIITVTVALAYSLICLKRDRRQKQKLAGIWLVDCEYEKRGKSIAFSNRPEAGDIAASAKKVDDFCRANCLVPSRSILISLAVEEMLVLSAAHAEIKANDLLDIRVVIYEDEVILRIRYAGKEFNPLDYYYIGGIMESEISIDDMLELGDKLGIRMIKSKARDIDYRRTFGVNNLTVVL